MVWLLLVYLDITQLDSDMIVLILIKIIFIKYNDLFPLDI